jgi:peptidoglycan/LPS O-acetylase OafA/YrhL
MTLRKPNPGPSRNVEGFDGLRALAACTVLTYHVALWSGYGALRGLAPVLWELKGGVAVFFVISGALLYLPYARAIRDARALPNWRGYAHRRVLRITPAYWVALTLVLVGPFGAVLGTSLWRYYALSEIYTPQGVLTGLGVAWSLCVELSFYALLPLFAALAARLARPRGDRGRVRMQLILIVVAAMMSLALRGLVAGSLSAPTPHSGTTLMVSLPGLLDWFAIGMALAVLRAELEVSRAASGAIARLGRHPARCVLLSFALFLAAVPFQHGDVFLPWYGLITHVAIGLGSGALVLAVIVPRPMTAVGLTRRLLRHPVAVWVGTISYGVYLWHYPVLELIAPHLSTHPARAAIGAVALMWGLVLAGGVGLGAASWYLVELPFQRVFGPRPSPVKADGTGGRPAEVDAAVQPQRIALNPSGVVVDHLA